MMDQALIERLAREAGFSIREYPQQYGGNEIHGGGHETWDINEELRRFAALVAETCALMADYVAETPDACGPSEAAHVAAAIRATFKEP